MLADRQSLCVLSMAGFHVDIRRLGDTLALLIPGSKSFNDPSNDSLALVMNAAIPCPPRVVMLGATISYSAI